MGNTSKHRLGELTRALFQILIKHPDGMQAKDALAALAASVALTDYEQGFYSPGVRRFDKVVRFGTIGLVKAGWMTKTNGRWAVTEEGRRAFDQHRDPEVFRDEMTRLYREWKHARPGAEEDADAEDASDERNVVVTLEVAQEQARAEIDRYLLAMPPFEFQRLVASLLEAMDYHVDWIAPPGKDGGIDIIAFPDPLGTKLPRIKVQVKRHSTAAVPVDGLRSFMAQLGDDDVGLFVCTAGFTRDAQEEARTQAKRRVTLVDLDRLIDLWEEHYDRLNETDQRRLPLQHIAFLAPRES